TVTEQVVVLLDEFDEMGRDRTRSQELLSRFITTAMLPKLASINDERKLVFLLATNYVSNFDAAFSRSGRFDMRVQVMVPSLAAKLRKWAELGSLRRHWPARTKRDMDGIPSSLTFLECKQLVEKLKGKKAVATVTQIIRAAGQTAPLMQPNNTMDDEEGSDR